ncbi:MAG: EFR1 family ferrodoxin [Anaerolineaceae bacterium]|nr:EFR1 family ferrodoxin [Anaerolineaceae bacterium]
MNKQITSIFYFSGTGNTWWVSEHIAKELSTRGFHATAHSIEQVNDKETADLIEKSSIIGLGFPIYGSDVPRIFHNFIRALPKQKDQKPVLGFVTQMAWSGNGMNFLEKELINKGYRIRWAAEFRMPNNIAIPIFPLPYSSDFNHFKPLLEQCSRQITDLCAKISNDKDYRQHTHWIHAVSAWMQRGPFRLTHDWGNKFWSVDPEACTSCGRCARICPVDNIHMRDGLPVFGRECVYCMRCFNYCPTLAIHYLGMKNTRAKNNPPFQGPVPTFRPEMITKKKN